MSREETCQQMIAEVLRGRLTLWELAKSLLIAAASTAAIAWHAAVWNPVLPDQVMLALFLAVWLVAALFWTDFLGRPFLCRNIRLASRQGLCDEVWRGLLHEFQMGRSCP
jgi:hypothetical protein